MSEPTLSPLNTPAELNAVIEQFDTRTDAYSVGDVDAALRSARQALGTIAEEMWKGAKAELLAFSFAAGQANSEPTNTYFGPMGSGTRQDGTVVYFSDPREADQQTLSHWKARARGTKSPLLVARYSDLVWDLAPLAGKEKRDAYYARQAIDAYLNVGRQADRKAVQAFPIAERALSLSIQLKDGDRCAKARALVLDLHKQQIAQPKGMWWSAWDIFDRYSKAELSDAERKDLVADLESVLARVSKSDDPSNFDPHAVEDVANKLAAYYRRTKAHDDVKRVTIAVAKAFERFGETADPHLGSLVLQTSLDAYRAAGLAEDAERIVKMIGEKNLASVTTMTKSEHRIELPPDEVEAYLNAIMQPTAHETFIAIASQFLMRRAKVEEALRRLAKVAPLATMISQTHISGDRIVSQIGSLQDDPTGRLIDQASRETQIASQFLFWSFERAKDVHKFAACDVTSLANRVGLFGDGKLLDEGVNAWIAGDHVKALHVLIPQIEAALRTMLGNLGRPTTKAYRNTQMRMVMTMSDFLNDEETAVALGKHGPDLVLHLRVLYADPRGWNLRNNMAHGLLPAEAANDGTSIWLIHTLLLFGTWFEEKMADAEF